jgi:hypothetical protein
MCHDIDIDAYRSGSRIQSLLSVLVVLVSLLGCGSRGELAAVRGKVTLDGQALPNAFVVYAPTTKGTTSYGRTDAGGNYEMMFTDYQKGAWIGENSVRISTGDVGSGGASGPKERVPIVYNQETTLVADVKQGSNTFNFDLKSNAGKIRGAPTE